MMFRQIAAAREGQETLPADLTPAGRARRIATGAFNVNEIGVVLPLIVLIVVFTLIRSSFLSTSDIEAMLIALSYIGIISVGETILMISGEFDLSVGSNAGLSAVGAAWTMTHGVPAVLGIGIGIGIGITVGAVNAFVVVKLGIPAFIATIGMLYIGQGVTLLIGNGYPFYPLPSLIGDIGTGRVLSVSYGFVLLVVLVIVGEFVLRRTTFGRAAYATGGNREVARIAGINVGRIKAVSFIVTGALSAVAGILVMSSVASANSDIGGGYELLVIASVVIGGVSLFGGVGSVIGAFLGVVLLQVVQSGLVVDGLSANWQTVAVGLIMILAVGADVLRRRIRTS
ncbi:MAG TPA: ABC transporter permease [Trebonia sp.]|jgi:ribose transport system permease protein|nr:ABC transporter permease [Trebonia sp.]